MDKKIKLKRVLTNDISFCLFMYAAIVIFKILFVIGNNDMPQVSDEFNYIAFSKALLTKGSYNSTQYPILYPMALMPALAFGDHYYLVMKVLNVLYSSLTPVIVYFLGKLYLNKKNAMICSCFSALVPYNFVMPMTIMSENIYFPILMFTIYILLREYEKREIFFDLLLGICCGLLYLSRHITFVILPVFALVWLLKQIDKKTNFFQILARGGLVLVLFVVTYLPWVLMCKSHGNGMKQILGFGIASRTAPEQLTAERLGLSAIFYLSYFCLILAPFLGSIFKSIFCLQWKKITCSYNRLWILVFGLSAALFVAVTRHSWRAFYNYPVFEKIKGRYVIYVPTLMFLLVMVSLFSTEERKRIKNNVVNIIVTYIIPVCLIVMGYLIDIYGLIQPLAKTFIGSVESSDGQRIKFLNIWYIIVCCLFMCLFQIGHDYGKKYRDRVIIATFAVGVGLLQIQGMPSYYAYLENRNEEHRNGRDKLFLEVKADLDNIGANKRTVVYVGDLTRDNRAFIKGAFGFYNCSNVVVVSDLSIITSTIYYVLTDNIQKYEFDEIMANYNWNTEEYYLLQLTKK